MKYGMWATQGQSIFIEATVSNFGTSEMWFTASEDQKQSRSSAVNTNYSVAQFAGKLGDKKCEPTPRWLEMNDNYLLHNTSYSIPIRRVPPALRCAVWGSRIVWICSWHHARSQLSGLPLQPASIFSRGDSVLALMRAKKKKPCSSRGGSLWEPRLLQSLVATALVVVQPLTGWN